MAITGGIFYCRVSEGFSVSATSKLSCNLTGQCFEIGNKNIPPIVGAHAKKNSKHVNTKERIKFSLTENEHNCIH
jgi:hypothetical protein